MERTESEIIAREPIRDANGQPVSVKLGERTYNFYPLTMRKAMKWRASLSPLLVSMLSKDGALENPETLRDAIINSPEQMAKAIFAYLEFPEHQWDELLDQVTEPQIIAAFFPIMGAAFNPIKAQLDIAEFMKHPEKIPTKQATAQSEPPSRLQ